MTPMPRSLPQVGEPPAGPPLWLPLAFLAQAVLWLVLASGALVIVGPELAAGVIASPRVVATTHLFTLGVLGAATLGALHQFIPVVTGVGLRHPKAAVWSCGIHLAGVLQLIASMWWWSPRGQLVGWGLLFLAVGLGSWNILPARRQARQNGYVAAFVSLAHSALGLGMAIALVRIGDGLGWWATSRDGQLIAHLHLGWLGYGTLIAAGIGSKMLPAFLGLAEHADVQRAPPAYRWIGWLISVGLVALAAGAPFHLAWLTWPAVALLAGGVAVHLVVLVGYFRRRKAGPLDPSLVAIAAAVAAYALTWALGLVLALARPGAPKIWAAYGFLAVGGWLTLLIVGVMHRIGPRLMTNYLSRRGLGMTLAQRGGQLLNVRLAWGSVSALGLGVAITAPGILLGSTVIVTTGTLTYLLGAVMVMAQAGYLGRTVRPRSAPSSRRSAVA
jgi:hypothetical protein